MDQRDEFSKWMSAVEEALSSEAKPVAEDVPPMGQECGCGAWDCPACFPEQNEMPGMQGAMDGLGGHNPEVIVIGAAAPMGGMDPMAQMGGMEGGSACPTCGHSHDEGSEHEMETEIPFEDGSAGGMGAAGMASAPQPMVDEQPMDFDQTPEKPSFERGQKGGVKLGHIVQKFVSADQDGENSPLTYGEDNLDEEEGNWYNPDMDDFSNSTHDYENDSPVGQRDMSNQKAQAAEFGSASDADIEAMGDMVGKIMYMQNMGLSKSGQPYTEEQLASMSPSQVKQVHDEVMGTVSEELPPDTSAGATPIGAQSIGAGPSAGGGSPASPGGNYAPGTAPTMPESAYKGQKTMENIDKDVEAMLNSLKKYDKLKESVSPVLGMVTLGEKKGGKPDWLENVEKKAEKKEGKAEDSDESKKDAKEDKGFKPFTKGEKKDDKKEDVKEAAGEADPDVIAWMSRFANLGNMKGYGR